MRHSARRFVLRPLSRLGTIGLRLLRAVRGVGNSASTSYRAIAQPRVERWAIRVFTDAPAPTFDAWRRRQTLTTARAVTAGATEETPFFYVPGALDDSRALDPAFLESSFLVLAAEALDAVTVAFDHPAGSVAAIDQPTDVTAEPWRSRTLFRSTAWRYDKKTDSVSPTRLHADLRIKVIDRSGVVEPPALDSSPQSSPSTRRGSYRSSRLLPRRLTLEIHDASRFARTPRPERLERPGILVVAPFLARGGAEHTLFETLAARRERYDVAFVTVAPHRLELGDRRADFQALWPRLYCLGDLVHPAAMPGMLASIIEAFAPQVLYNANSSTLFYDFVPELRRRFPELRILDHLYDHRVGYIERYGDPALLDHVDAVVAENRHIAEVLIDDRGWPAERVPVVWSCGRADADVPKVDDHASIRQRLRRELDYDDDAIIVLTAARMHEQKRPLDLVRLAERVRDVEQVHFLMVGGGDLEDTVDRAIDAAQGARIRRLPFRSDIPDLIAMSDVGCLVSQFEGLPVFLLECLQVGRPFLGTDVGEIGVVLKATGAGWLVDEPGDMEALDAAVRRLADDRERTTKAERARLAGPRFGVAPCAERYTAVFDHRPLSTDPMPPDSMPREPADPQP